jgi:hypothetical protein
MIGPGFDLKSNILVTKLLLVPRNNKTQKVLIIADIEWRYESMLNHERT